MQYHIFCKTHFVLVIVNVSSYSICVADSEKTYPCDIVVLAMGFLGPEKAVIESLSLNQDPRSNIETSRGSYATNVPRVYAAGGRWRCDSRFCG